MSKHTAKRPRIEDVEDEETKTECDLQPSIGLCEIFRFDLVFNQYWLARLVSHVAGKPWREWTDSETSDVVCAFRARASISWTDTQGSLEERHMAEVLYGEVTDRAAHDKRFAAQLDPFYVVVCFGVGGASAAAPAGWAATVAASPVVVAPVNGSDYFYACNTRENAAIFLGYIFHAGFHGWLFTSSNLVHHWLQ